MKQKKYHHGNLKKDLINGALLLVEKNGLAGLSLREVAQIAGVSHTAPYRHFKDRTELLASIAEQGFIKLLTKIKKIITTKEHPLDVLKAIGLCYVDFAFNYQSHFQIMFTKEIGDRKKYPDLQMAAYQVVLVLKKTVTDCQQKGKWPHQHRDAIAMAFWSIAHGVAELTMHDQIPQKFHWKKVAKSTIEVFLSC